MDLLCVVTFLPLALQIGDGGDLRGVFVSNLICRRADFLTELGVALPSITGVGSRTLRFGFWVQGGVGTCCSPTVKMFSLMFLPLEDLFNT